MDDLTLALEAARAGARVVREWMGRLEAADFKGEVDPVTAADRQAEEAVLELIRSRRPDDGILSEETGRSASGRRQWVVDPLDGTVNFVHEVPHVAVSVALCEGEDPIAGVVIDVFREDEFSVERGEGVWLDGRRLGVTGRDDLGNCLLATGFPYDRRDHAAEYAAAFGAVLARARGIRRMGTAAIDLAWVAAGRYDGFWELKLARWDVAAGMLMVKEAGGTVTDHHGRPYELGMQTMVATNGLIHEPLRMVVKETLPAHMRAGPES